MTEKPMPTLEQLKEAIRLVDGLIEELRRLLPEPKFREAVYYLRYSMKVALGR